ncbi:PIN domain protein [Chthoniobacter flavus Ellin428]|uniref:PIN domain protein n=1 Tax=Chthoniobacter flavus Ellin428 TaxID=497964 RepID=B4CV07_9BACT|nr:PIN domain-containing protein [Chthoniobacter flavus]EDY22395.1 PIN domain protein [Chthoniobacter flavus Ellin428]TCO94592.1 putative nucleic acid-binding protein [Chthoniobacter flavus]
MRVFLDTNIVLDVLLNRPAFIVDSEAVILRCESIGHPMFIAWHGLATVYYLLKRGRTESEALIELDKLLSWVCVADCSDADARTARALSFTDFEDALQAVSAAASAADLIVTRNIADFSRSKVPAVTPQELLQRLPIP